MKVAVPFIVAMGSEGGVNTYEVEAVASDLTEFVRKYTNVHLLPRHDDERSYMVYATKQLLTFGAVEFGDNLPNAKGKKHGFEWREIPLDAIPADILPGMMLSVMAYAISK